MNATGILSVSGARFGRRETSYTSRSLVAGCLFVCESAFWVDSFPGAATITMFALDGGR